MTFNFYIGGYGRDSYRLELHNNELRCSEYYGVSSDCNKINSLKGDKDWGNSSIPKKLQQDE
ncbi:hypothetical protein ACSX1A_16390 [Pontibacter sp. MBLB2868]|uniref:hypothetical protein n=1 Tax=Pontibacter sp. MBLB2868 TaxID=3451555 RepID=UPI003F750580